MEATLTLRTVFTTQGTPAAGRGWHRRAVDARPEFTETVEKQRGTFVLHRQIVRERD